MGQDTDAVVRRLADEVAIKDVALRYARAIDRKDFDLLRTCYHEDAHENHGAYRGDIEGFVSWLETTALPVFERSLHYMTNQRVEIDGDNAWMESYGCAVHKTKVTPEKPEPENTTTWLRYVDYLQRRDGEWRIADRVCVFEFGGTVSFGPPLDVSNRITGTRDRSDPSYARPR